MVDAALVDASKAEFEALARELEASPLQPRAIIFMHYEDTNDWKLILVPKDKNVSERDIYAGIAKILAGNRAKYPSIEVSDIRLMSDKDPLVQALGGLTRVDQFGKVVFSKSMIGNVYIPDIVVYRMAL